MNKFYFGIAICDIPGTTKVDMRAATDTNRETLEAVICKFAQEQPVSPSKGTLVVEIGPDNPQAVDILNEWLILIMGFCFEKRVIILNSISDNISDSINNRGKNEETKT